MVEHPADQTVAAAVAKAHREEWAFVLAATVRLVRDIDLAEECVQDAYAKALTAWSHDGIPRKPGAWLTTAARNRGLDVLRRSATQRAKLPLLVEPHSQPPAPDDFMDDDVPDDRLRLIFTCCHPALSIEARIALTLRLLCGLTTAEVAKAFLVSESTMAARITRAKKKIAAAHIPYRIPTLADLPERIDSVVEVVHLLFSTGYAAPTGDSLVRRDLVDSALHLARMLRTLLPNDSDVAGLRALLLLTDARRETRTAPDGRLLLLSEQDRDRWDRAAIAEGTALVRESLRHRGPGKYTLMAAIAAVHDESPAWEQTDWPEIVGLYDLLLRIWPSPIVALNRAVAVSEAAGPAQGLAELDALAGEPTLAAYHYLAAARADLLRRLGRTDEARLAYQEALLLAGNAVERDFLAARLDELG